MKLSIPILVSALCILPNVLTASTPVQTTQRFSLLRCSDLEIIDAENSYGFQTYGKDKIQYLSPSGDFYIVNSYNPKTKSFSCYQYFKTDTCDLMRTESLKPNRRFVETSEGLLAYSDDMSLTDLSSMNLRWYHKRFKDMPFYIHNSTLLTVGPGASQRIYGYSLATGEKLWNVNIGLEGGISDIYPLDDDHILIVADDLVKLNTKTGARKKLDIKNYVINGKMLAGQILAGVAMGVAAGAMAAGTGSYFYVVPVPKRYNPRSEVLNPVYGDASTISYLSSNIVNYGDLYYLADRNGVRCFDSNLEVKWTTEFQHCHGTTSKLSLSGDTLILVNYGVANFRSADRDNSGTPFVATYKANTGKCLSFDCVGEKHAPVQQVISNEFGAAYLFDDSCKYVPFDNPKEISMSYKKGLSKDYTLLGSQVYVFNLETHKFDIPDKNTTYLVDKEVNLYQIESNNVSLANPKNTVYQPKGMFADSLMVVLGGPNGKDCWFINEEGTPVYHVMEPVESVAVGTEHLLLFSKTAFTVISSDMLKPTELSDVSVN